MGKTVVSIGLLRLAARQGLRLVPFKPAETGCVAATPPTPSPCRRRPTAPIFRWASSARIATAPRSPRAAATHKRPPLTLASLAAAARRAARLGDALLVEGAGGLLTPYGSRLTIADLAARLALPVILVARNALGTINHTALCAAELRRRQLDLLAIVLVDVDRRPHPQERNAELITAATGVRPVLLRRLRRPSPDAVADALGRSGQRWLRQIRRRP